MKKLQFTVFTPVFNRKHVIHRVWDSLLAQTYRDFEWIVVDDGSTDGVGDLLEEYKSEADFDIRIIIQENSGKHVAWNRAVDMARGELFVPADSDDGFIPTTLERFKLHWDSIPEKDKGRFSGVNVHCMDPETGSLIGEEYPGSPMVSNNLELHYVHGIRGEKWGCIRTDVLKERPNIEVNGSYLPENWIWYHLARKYDVLCVNEMLRMYYTDSDVCLSTESHENILRSAESIYYFRTWNLNENLDYILRYDSKINLVKHYIVFWRYGLLSGRSIFGILKDLKFGVVQNLGLLTLVPGGIIYMLTYKKYR